MGRGQGDLEQPVERQEPLLAIAHSYLAEEADKIEGLIEGMPSETQESYRSSSKPHAALRAVEELAALLREAWEFPEYPGPGEGLVSTSEDYIEQDAWRERWEEMDERVRRALGEAE